MKKSEKDAIYRWAAGLSDKELEDEYYNFVYGSNEASRSEEMYELGFDIQDCIEEDKWAKYCSEKNEIVEELCMQRGIKLWEHLKEGN